MRGRGTVPCDERVDEVVAASRETQKIQWLNEAEFERRIRHLTQDAGATRENEAEGQFSISGAQVSTLTSDVADQICNAKLHDIRRRAPRAVGHFGTPN